MNEQVNARREGAFLSLVGDQVYIFNLKNVPRSHGWKALLIAALSMVVPLKFLRNKAARLLVQTMIQSAYPEGRIALADWLGANYDDHDAMAHVISRWSKAAVSS